MNKHLKYARYIAIHKWFVMLACFRRGLIWQGILHDWSKFLPSEWMPYAEFFYGRGTRMRPQPVLVTDYEADLEENRLRVTFNRAWLKHQHRSPHHWQHWVLRNDDGTTVALEMPLKYVLEMLSDWDGAGRAITGQSGGTGSWYVKNCVKMMLHPNTRTLVERHLLTPELRLYRTLSKA